MAIYHLEAKTAQQRSLTNEKKQTPAWSLLKKRELTQRINALTEELEDLCAHAANFDPQILWPERLRERENLTNEARTELKTRLGADYSERRLDYAEQDLRRLLAKEVRKLRQYGRALQSAGYHVIARNNRKRSNDMVR